MLKVIVAVALVVAFLGPAVSAFAAQADEGSGGDRAPYLAAEPIQSEPVTIGIVAGADKPYFGPYFEQRLDNVGE